MSNSKIIIKPFSHGEEVDKSRKITGIDKWARSSPFIGNAMLILGWFTIPFDVILRRDFGQRFFTLVTFYAGMFLLIAVICLQSVVSMLWPKILDSFHSSSGAPTSQQDSLQEFMLFFLLYFYMGRYHLFKIKWRNQAGIPLHSFDDGTSRLQWLSKILVWIVNLIAMPGMVICYYLIPPKQRKGKPYAKFIADGDAFMTTTLEPVIVFLAAFAFTGAIALWLLLSSFAMLIHARWKEMARKNKFLDFQDGKIEAELMRELKNATQEKGTEANQKAERAKRKPQAVPQLMVRYPNLTSIIDDMYRGKTNSLR